MARVYADAGAASLLKYADVYMLRGRSQLAQQAWAQYEAFHPGQARVAADYAMRRHAGQLAADKAADAVIVKSSVLNKAGRARCLTCYRKLRRKKPDCSCGAANPLYSENVMRKTKPFKSARPAIYKSAKGGSRQDAITAAMRAQLKSADPAIRQAAERYLANPGAYA